MRTGVISAGSWVVLCLLLCILGCHHTDGDADTVACASNDQDSIDFLASLPCASDFARLQGKPLNQIYGNVHSVKFAYSIHDETLYFINTGKFTTHFSFCSQILGYPKTSADFLTEQYSSHANRLYYLGTVSHYGSSDLHSMEFIAGDKITGAQIELVYQAIAARAYFAEQLKFYPTSSALDEQVRRQNGRVPLITSEELFKNQNYQALHAGQNYGYLERIAVEDIGSRYLGRHAILLTNGVPNDIPVVAAVITTDFQTPLSHVNVLSQNRNTPNMALRSGWEDSTFRSLEGKLVRLEVKPDTFSISEAELTEAEVFWRRFEPSTGIMLACNDSTAGLFDTDSLDHKAYSLVGAKAANFAELGRVDVDTLPPLPLPEGGFAIPFYYYRQHLRANGLDSELSDMLSDSGFQIDAETRKSMLSAFRAAIVKAPLDSGLLNLVIEKVESRRPYTRFRFRSSTNAEDTEIFNGAGLYASETGGLGDPDKPIDMAIKRVWASLWTFPAFEERAYYRIDPLQVAMGILAHRSFPEELANGVAITKNLYNPKLPAYTINVQEGETSVVSPEPGVICDQLLFYPFYEKAFDSPVIEYIAHSNLTRGRPVLSDSEVLLLSQYLYRIQNWFQHNVYSGTRPASEMPAMDVEFKFDSPSRKLYIKQARPY